MSGQETNLWDELTAEWAGMRMRFDPDCHRKDLPVKHALVAIIDNDRFLLAKIKGRGYCVPSGRIEPGEMPEQAIRRESFEEAGALLRSLQRIGCYYLSPASGGEEETCAPLFLGELAELLPLPPGSESEGARWAAIEELPALYYQWSTLLEAVFRYALEKSRQNPVSHQR